MSCYSRKTCHLYQGRLSVRLVGDPDGKRPCSPASLGSGLHRLQMRDCLCCDRSASRTHAWHQYHAPNSYGSIGMPVLRIGVSLRRQRHLPWCTGARALQEEEGPSTTRWGDTGGCKRCRGDSLTWAGGQAEPTADVCYQGFHSARGDAVGRTPTTNLTFWPRSTSIRLIHAPSAFRVRKAIRN